LPIMALVFALFLGGGARSQEIQTLGVGSNTSCDRWLADRASNDYFAMGNWALGFLSAVGMYSGNLNPLKGLDSHAVLYWLDNYCRVRPTDGFTDTLKAFIRQHPE
jgi:hypothetical protein